MIFFSFFIGTIRYFERIFNQAHGQWIQQWRFGIYQSMKTWSFCSIPAAKTNLKVLMPRIYRKWCKQCWWHWIRTQFVESRRSCSTESRVSHSTWFGGGGTGTSSTTQFFQVVFQENGLWDNGHRNKQIRWCLSGDEPGTAEADIAISEVDGCSQNSAREPDARGK